MNKRTLAIMLAAVCAATSLVGCGPRAGSGEAASSAGGNTQNEASDENGGG